MGAKSRYPRTASLARGAIPFKSREPRRIHARAVRRVQRQMHADAQGEGAQPSSKEAQDKQRQRSDRTVQRAGRLNRRRLARVEEADGRREAQAALVSAEPQIVVGVDENASSPQTQHAATEPRA
jgi:hypothetical protein